MNSRVCIRLQVVQHGMEQAALTVLLQQADAYPHVLEELMEIHAQHALIHTAQIVMEGLTPNAMNASQATHSLMQVSHALQSVEMVSETQEKDAMTETPMLGMDVQLHEQLKVDSLVRRQPLFQLLSVNVPVQQETTLDSLNVQMETQPIMTAATQVVKSKEGGSAEMEAMQLQTDVLNFVEMA